MEQAELKPGDVVKRHRLSTRLWHWTNALTLLVMLMSGLKIYNAAPIYPLQFPPDITLGGWLAGALEAAAVLLSFEKRLIPPTRGTTSVDPAMSIDVVIDDPRPWTPGPTISNNFGFGGHNGSVIIAPAN